MRRFLGLLSIAALLFAPAVRCSAQTASAATTHWPFVAVAGVRSASPPNSNIKLNHLGVAKYAPKTLAATWSGFPGKLCNPSLTDFQVTNLTASSQTVSYNGSVIATIPSDNDTGFCLWGTGSESLKFGLGSSAKKPTVNLT